MGDKRGSNVDSDTLLAIQDGNKEVIKEFRKDLSQTTTDIKEYLLLHISPLKDDVNRVNSDINRVRGDVADLYDKDRAMRDRVGILEQRQSVDEGSQVGRDIAEEKANRKTEISFGKISGVIAIASLVGGVIGYFLF